MQLCLGEAVACSCGQQPSLTLRLRLKREHTAAMRRCKHRVEAGVGSNVQHHVVPLAAAEQQPEDVLDKALTAVVEELLRQAVTIVHGEAHRALRGPPPVRQDVHGRWTHCTGMRKYCC